MSELGSVLHRHPRCARAAAAVCLLLAGSVAFYSLRAPVVVVSDAASELLYGEKRSAAARLFFSVGVFRPVRLALVSESSSPESSADIALLAADGRDAACFIFPIRYFDGAAAICSRFPGAKVAVIGDAPAAEASESMPAVLSIDRAADIYRAGRLAAILANGRRLVLRIVSSDDPWLVEQFSQGVKDAGGTGAPALFTSAEEAPLMEEGAFIVDAGRDAAGPVSASVSYSWSDPAFWPAGMAAAFDDSPTALLAEGYKVGRRRTSASVPSKIRVPGIWEFSPRRILAIQAVANSRRH
jgi:hypothetical protein